LDRGQFFEKKIAQPYCVLFLKCPGEILRNRLYSRALTELRSDDKYEVISKRIAVFDNGDFARVLDYYEQKGILVTVDASKSQQEVLASIAHRLNQHLDLLHVS
jgi:adenylate kinase family enzyme